MIGTQLDMEDEGGYSSGADRSWDEDYQDLVHAHNDDFEYEDNQQIIAECKKSFESKDFIMEPIAGQTVRKYLNAGGAPEEFMTLLSDNYDGIAQAANLVADWLIVAGASVQEVQEIVEKQLKDLIIKYFDPSKADSIFSGSGQPPSWIEEMIAHAPWRMMFYELAEKFPDCLMLNFTIKLISDAGYQSEIGAMSSACSQIDVFSKVLHTTILRYLNASQEGQPFVVDDLVKSACHGKMTYLYTQCLLSQAETNLGEQPARAYIRRLAQELAKGALESGHNTWCLQLIGLGSGAQPRFFSSLLSVLEKKTLNPGDVTVLYKAYTSPQPPSVDLLRIPLFLDLLIRILFKPGSSINPEHQAKYTFLLGYATSVWETVEDGESMTDTSELNMTVQAIERVHSVCVKDVGAASLQTTAEVGLLYQCIRHPVVAMGLMTWVEECLSEKNYPIVITEPTPLQIVLLDEVSSCHPLQHKMVLNLLTSFFSRSYKDLDTLVELEFKKTVLDRMIHLLSRGYVLPVVAFVKECMDSQTTDVSLLRHFVVEVLEMIAPPYSPAFIDIFLPIVSNSEITGTIQTADKEDDVSLFLAHCNENG